MSSRMPLRSRRWNAPISRFSVTGHAREQLAALRRLRDAELDDVVRRLVGDVAPLEPDRARGADG